MQDDYIALIEEKEILITHSELDSSISQSGDSYHLLLNQKSYQISLLKADFLEKTYTLKVDNEVFEVRILDKVDQMVRKMGLKSNSDLQIKDIKAPMPGTVLELKAAEGQEVQTGDTLLILEAMKMENMIKAPGDGKIKSISVSQGQAVEKGMILIEME